ncbi:MAG: signal peptidase II [Candidatus Uhrbacteria bacterium]|nr:signal peptidase II [Candidatus Uhrbacteria bacterium]
MTSAEPKKTIRLIALLVPVVAIGLADVIFKYIALSRLPEEGSRLRFLIDFALHKNPGIAFDIPIPLSIVIALTLIISAVLLYHSVRSFNRMPMMSFFSLTIIIGALGNMIDRVINGFTTDYIILFERSAINLSDILILFGTIMLLVYSKDRSSELDARNT